MRLILGDRSLFAIRSWQLCFVLIVCYIAGIEEQFRWIPTKSARILTCVTYGYVFLALTIFHLSLGGSGISMFISIYEAILPFMLFRLFVLCTVVPLSTLGGILMLVEAVRDMDKTKFLECLKVLASCLVVGGIAAYMIFSVRVNGIPLIPDVAVSISEKDQIAALLGGVVTLCFTLGHIVLSKVKEEESEGEEMQRLASDVD
jgi:hypothetical protein